MKQDVLGAKHFHEALATTPKDSNGMVFPYCRRD